MTRTKPRPAPRTAVDLLLVQRPEPAMDAPVSRVGGLPLAPAGAPWPGCATCGDPMQFILQLRLRDVGGVLAATDGLLLVWQCESHGASCEPGEPDGRANFATFTTLDRLRVMPSPHPWPRREPPCQLFGCYELMTVPIERPVRAAYADEDAWRAADPYQRLIQDDRDVVGLVTPRLDWLRGDPALRCDACDLPLVPILQIENKAGGGIGFGMLGAGYALYCEGCVQATWLHQDTPGYTIDEAFEPDADPDGDAPEDALDEPRN